MKSSDSSFYTVSWIQSMTNKFALVAHLCRFGVYPFTIFIIIIISFIKSTQRQRNGTSKLAELANPQLASSAICPKTKDLVMGTHLLSDVEQEALNWPSITFCLPVFLR